MKMHARNSDIAFFESLEDICHLITDMSEVNLACSLHIIRPQNSIGIKNLLLDNFIMNMNIINAQRLREKRAQFKDWITEKISQKMNYVTSKTSAVSLQKFLPAPDIRQTISNVPVIPEQSALSSNTAQQDCYAGVRRNIYSTEVYRIKLSGTSVDFDSAAAFFNQRFVCNINANCKLIKKERHRKYKNSTTQLYKCNCCTTDVNLQFRHNDSSAINGVFAESSNNYVVTVCIKSKLSDNFCRHYTTRTSTRIESIQGLPT
jgi:hypothetical protein